jgi:hypothetical protein
VSPELAFAFVHFSRGNLSEKNRNNKKSQAKYFKKTSNESVETYFESDRFVGFCGEQKILPTTIWRFNTLLIG